MHKPVALILLTVSCASAPIAANSAPVAATKTWIHNVRIFDGERVSKHNTVLISNSTILEVGTPKPPPGAQIIDATGMTLLPGFIDSHVHVHSVQAMRQSAVFGVTTLLDMMDNPQAIAELKKQASAESGLADVFTAGFSVTVAGGHGTEYGGIVPTIEKPSDANEFVAARIAEGSDYVKLVYDDGAAYGLSQPTLSPELLRAAVDATHARKKLAVVHVGSLSGAITSIEAGADGLAHLFVDTNASERFISRAAQQNTFVVPTLASLLSVVGRPDTSILSHPEVLKFLDPDSARIIHTPFPTPNRQKLDWQHAANTTRALDAANVEILAGTDAPNPGTAYGVSLHTELLMLVRSGLSPLRALGAATGQAAKRFALGDRGRIIPGALADLILVQGDPTQDIDSTARIVHVWKRGQLVDRLGFEKAVAAARKAHDEKMAAIVVPDLKDGVISRFDDLSMASKFGAGWQKTTDSVAQGTSSVQLRLVRGGALKSAGALQIDATITPKLPFAWAGALFSPANNVMEPSNLSSMSGIRFWAKGDGGEYKIWVYTQAGGFIAASKTFKAERKWQQFKFAWSDFNGSDGRDVTAIAFVAGSTPGKYQWLIDDVRLDATGQLERQAPE